MILKLRTKVCRVEDEYQILASEELDLLRQARRPVACSVPVEKYENCSSRMLPADVCDSPTTAHSQTTYRLCEEGLEGVESILKLHALRPRGGILKTGHGEISALLFNLTIRVDILLMAKRERSNGRPNKSGTRERG